MTARTLVKALAVLDELANADGPIGVRQLAKQLDLDPATVHRLLTTFRQRGYVDQDPDSKAYVLGPTVVHHAAAYRRSNPLPSVAIRVFNDYRDRFNFNFYLATLKNGLEFIYLAVVEGDGPIKVVVEPGGRMAGLHTTAVGKMLLASQDDDFVADYVARCRFEPITPRTIVTEAELREELTTIRAQGFALNDGEHYPEIGSVSSPLVDAHGHPVAAISLAYPRVLVTEETLRLDDLVELTKSISEDIHRLSYDALNAG